MPIVAAGIVVVPPPGPGTGGGTGGTGTPPVVTRVVPRRTIELAGANGDVLQLTDPIGGVRVIATRGVLGLAPVDPQFRDGIADGSQYQRTRRLQRPMDLRLRMSTSNRDQLRTLLARLAAIVDGGKCTLTVRQPDGGGRSIDCYYATGMELETGGSAGSPLWQEVPLTLVAPDPFFYGTDPVTIVWALATGKALLGSGNFFPVQLAANGVLGSVVVTNVGDVPANATWTIAGPGGPVTIEPAAGAGFTIPTPLEFGDTIVVDTTAPTVVDGTGANVYDRLGPAPKLWTIPPGATTANVSVTDATDDTSVTLTYRPRFRLGG